MNNTDIALSTILLNLTSALEKLAAASNKSSLIEKEIKTIDYSFGVLFGEKVSIEVQVGAGPIPTYSNKASSPEEAVKGLVAEDKPTGSTDSPAPLNSDEIAEMDRVETLNQINKPADVYSGESENKENKQANGDVFAE